MVKGLKEQVEKLKNEKSFLLDQMQQLEQKIVVADEKTKNLLKRLSEIKFRKGDDATLEFDRLTDDIQELTKDQYEFRKLLKSAETRNLSMTSQIADLETKMQTLSLEKAEREAALDKDNQSLRDTVKNLTKVVEDMQKKLEEKPRLKKETLFQPPPLPSYDTPRSPSTSSQAPQTPVETPKSPESDDAVARLIDEILANAKVHARVEKLPFGYYQIGEKKIRLMVLGMNRLAGKTSISKKTNIFFSVKENNGNWIQFEKWVYQTFVNRQTSSHVIQMDFLDPKGVRSLSPLSNGKPISPTEKSKKMPFPK
jgi:hypothetical protein